MESKCVAKRSLARLSSTATSGSGFDSRKESDAGRYKAHTMAHHGHGKTVAHFMA